ncbi:STAS domain-containing protein [Kitasatospora sp. NPDC059571]|uniref:STAS domain-containing protein n=1 Tax=Kitasatospora sp. NPDC059571 TaxID=3346871 RepID=UPI0036A83BE7
MGSGERGTGADHLTEAVPPVRTAQGPAGALVCSLAGDLDLDGLAGVEGPLRDIVASGPGLLCVDLSEVGFCDSSGLNLLLRLRLDAEDSGVPLVLAEPKPQLTRLFELTGAGAVFRIFDSVEEACAAG